MKVLLDTNALLWAAYAPERLTKNAVDAILAAEDLCFSILSPWEIALKLSRGGFRDFDVARNWEKNLMEAVSQEGFRMIPLELAHCRRVQDLPFHHKDPFDRMLIAQALTGNFTVIASDEHFDAYGVMRIW